MVEVGVRTIRVRSPSGEIVSFKAKTTTRFEKLAAAFAQQSNVKVEYFRFLCTSELKCGFSLPDAALIICFAARNCEVDKGEEIQPRFWRKTLQELGIENGDVLVANSPLGVLFQSHPSMDRLSQAAQSDLRDLYEKKEKDIEFLKQSIALWAEAGPCMMEVMFDPRLVTLLDQDENACAQVPLKAALQFSSLLGPMFQAGMLEERRQQCSLPFTSNTVRVLAKAIVFNESLWNSMKFFEGLSSDELVEILKAGDYLQSEPLFQAALAKLQKRVRMSPLFPFWMSVETAMIVMKHATCSPWRERWKLLEASAVRIVAELLSTAASGCFNTSLLKQLNPQHLEPEQVVRIVRDLNCARHVEWENLPNSPELQFCGDKDEVVLEMPMKIRSLALPVDDTAASIPLQMTIEAKLTATFPAASGGGQGPLSRTITLETSKDLENAENLDGEVRYLGVTRGAGANEEEEELPAQPLQAKLHTFRAKLKWPRTDPQPRAALAEASRVEVSWRAVPATRQLQAWLLLQGLGAPLLQAAAGPQHTAWPCLAQNPQVQTLLLAVTAELFPQLWESRQLLAWPAEAVKRLVEEMEALDAAQMRSSPPALKFLVAWAKHWDAVAPEQGGAAGAEGAPCEGRGRAVLEELMAAVDAGWALALDDSGGLTAAEQSYVRGSTAFNAVIRAALSQHYTHRPRKRRRDSEPEAAGLGRAGRHCADSEESSSSD